MVTAENETRSQPPSNGNRPKGEGASLVAAAARKAFAEKGYHAISMRELAQQAEVGLSTMYWFYPSKQDLLFALLEESVQTYAEIYSAALAEVDDDPLSRLDAFVGALVEYRARYRLESKLMDEIRSLEVPLREKIEYNADSRADLVRIIAAGVQAGVFTTPYPDEARRALTAMCNAVARWYDPAGPLSIRALIARHRQLARAILGCPIDADGFEAAEDPVAVHRGV
jgi:AcrR family transcriptional regulator